MLKPDFKKLIAPKCSRIHKWLWWPPTNIYDRFSGWKIEIRKEFQLFVKKMQKSFY